MISSALEIPGQVPGAVRGGGREASELCLISRLFAAAELTLEAGLVAAWPDGRLSIESGRAAHPVRSELEELEPARDPVVDLRGTGDCAHLQGGDSLADHEVHERAWVIVVGGQIEATSADGGRVSGGCGLLVEFAPGERHEVVARSNARLLLLLAPWSGEGHPGAMTLGKKLYARRPAAKARTL